MPQSGYRVLCVVLHVRPTRNAPFEGKFIPASLRLVQYGRTGHLQLKEGRKA